MLLRKVQLENFISHEKSELDFDYGINVIVGPNGSGKTSILDAISFGLFNIHSRGKKENLINRRAEAANLAVEFSEGGIEYIVEWTISRKKAANGVLFKIKDREKSIIARGGERVITSEVEKILGLDKDLFINSVYVQQGEIERLVTEPPANRKEIIAKLLGIEYLEKAYQNMREIINDYQRNLHTLIGELKRKPDIENKLQKLKVELENLEKSLSYENDALKSIEKRLKDLEAEIGELNRKKEKFTELSSKKAVLETNLANLNKNLEEKERELKMAEAAFEKVELIKEDVMKIPLMEKYFGLLQKLNEKEKEMKLEHQNLERIEGLKNILTQNEESYKAYLKKSGILKQKREERKNYEGAEKELAMIEKNLKEYSKKREKISKDLSKKLEEYSQILMERVTPENLESILAVKRSETERLKEELEEEVNKLGQEIGSVKGQIEELEFKLSKIAEAEICPICGRELTPEHRAKLQEEFEKVRQESSEKIVSLEGKLKRIKAEKRKCEETGEKLASVNSENIKGMVSEMEDLNHKIIQGQYEVQDLKRKAENLVKIDKEIGELESKIGELEKAYQEFLVAKRELENQPSKEELEANLEKLDREIGEISNEMEALTVELGYRPEKPEQELDELRRKKEDFDKNILLAEKRDELQRQVQGLRDELKSKNLEIQNIMAEIEALAYNEEVHRRKEEEFEDKKLEKNRVESEVARLSGEIKKTIEEMENYEGELNLLMEKERERVCVEQFVKILENIRGAFHKDGLQKLIRARARPLIEKITREFFERFNLEFSDVQIDEDYNISVVGPAGIQTIEQISGGERVTLAIALRLAIARVLSEKVETIIMDEPTTHLDEEKRKELINILNSFFKEGCRIIPQMLVITHHREIEDIADVLYSISKKEGYSIIETGK